MIDIISIGMAAILTIGVIAKFVWFGYILFFKPKKIPKDISGPVGGWG